MDLNPPTSGTKRPRTKAASATAESPKQPKITTKPTQVRKKPIAGPATEVTLAAGTIGYTSDQVRGMIAMAAYYRAASRNFAPGNEMEDWLVAEQQVIASLT